jgi:DNA-binding transcriptional ArsR family regulator
MNFTMNDEPDLSRLARTIGEPTRIQMLKLLMEGRALTAKELARGAGVEPATATAHLRRLLDDALVEATAQGRHKYFRLASPQVAQLIESLMVMAPPPKRSAAHDHAPIRVARFCYDHLAGRLGTHLTAALLARGFLAAQGKAFLLTPEGETWLQSIGIDVAEVRRSRRAFAQQCLDWSERKDHLGGALGAAIAERMLALGWITRTRHSRVVTITEAGHAALAEGFGLCFKDALAPA